MMVATFIFFGGMNSPYFFTTLFSQILTTYNLEVSCHPLSNTRIPRAPLVYRSPKTGYVDSVLALTLLLHRSLSIDPVAWAVAVI